MARSPQGQPVIVQAGSSETGRELAAQTAEVVFTAQTSLADAQAFYSDLKARLGQYGREADSLKIMPGVFVVVGQTEALAQAKFEAFQALVEPEVGVALLGRMLGNFDLSGYPLDGPLPQLPLTDSGQRSRQQLLSELAQREQLTLAQLGRRIAGGRGHYSVIGTPVQIADELQRWFEEGAADGFNILVPHLPGGLEDFAGLVVPELQRRGLFRREYTGTTLRETLVWCARAAVQEDAIMKPQAAARTALPQTSRTSQNVPNLQISTMNDMYLIAIWITQVCAVVTFTILPT